MNASPASVPTVPDDKDGRTTAVYLVVAAVLSLLLVGSIVSVDYLSTNDGPERIFAGQMLNHLHDPGKGYDQFLVENPTLTNIGFEIVFAKFEPWLGWRGAYRVVLCLLAMAWAWGMCALGASLGRGRRWLGLLGFPTALQWGFYMGLFSWEMGTALGFAALAWAFWRRSATTTDRLVLCALLLVQVVVHSFAAMLTGVVLLVYAVFTPGTKARLRAVALLVVQALPAMAVGVWTLVHHLGNHGAAVYNYEATPLGQRIVLLARGFVSGPWWRAWPVVVLAACGLAACRHWRDLDSRDRTLGLAGLGFTLAAVFLPLHTRAWEFFCVRFSPLGLMLLAMLALPRISMRLTGVAAAAAVVGYSVASIAWSWHHHVRIREASADVLAGLDVPLGRHGLRLPLPLEPPPGEEPDEWDRAIPYVATNSHLGALFAVAQGGVPTVLFAGMSAQSLRWRQPPETWMPPRPPRGFEWHLWQPNVLADPRLRESGLVQYLSFAAPFEDVILHARAQDAELLEQRGFAIDFRQGGLMLARFRGCPLSVKIALPPEGPTSAFLSAGWSPGRRPTFEAVLPGDAVSRSVAVTGSPCGEVWVRVLYDVDGDGKLSPGDRFCQGADANAVVRYRVQADASGMEFLCLPGPPRTTTGAGSEMR